LAFEVFGQDEQLAQQAQGAELADPRDAAEPRDLHGQGRLTAGECGGGLLQGFDPLLEVANIDGQIRGDESVAIRSKGNGVEPRLLASEFTAELDEAAAELLHREHRIGGRRPRNELHALQELPNPHRIDRVGLGAGQPGAWEVFDRAWIDDHDFDPLGPVQGECEAQAVNAGGLQADAGAGPAAGQQAEELPVAGGRVGQGAGTFGVAVAEEGHDQFTGADIEAGANHWQLFHRVVLGLVWSLRDPELLRMSSTDLVNAGSPPRQRGGGLRYSPVWTKKSGDRSNEQGRGGAVTPPCPQASAASRRWFHPLQFIPSRTSRSGHVCEIQGD
jgi:hypothetical protein